MAPASPTTETPAPLDETPASPTDETPAPSADEPAPSADEPAPSADEPKKDTAPTTGVEAGEIKPNYGVQKFRVGVKIADGSTVPDGATKTSTIRIVITDQDDEVVDDFTCRTQPLDPDSDLDEDPTSTFCDGDNIPNPFPLRGAAAAEVGPDDDYAIDDDQYFELEAGETATITQTKARKGLKKSSSVVTIAPCEAGAADDFPPGFPSVGDYCKADNIEVTPVKATKVLFADEAADPGEGSVSNNGADLSDGVLPDTGGSNASLLGYAALMLAGGGWLTARGRRRPSADSIQD